MTAFKTLVQSVCGGRAKGLGAGALVAVGVSLVMTLAFQTVPFLRASVQWISDFETASLRPLQPLHPDIVVVAVTEDTLAQFTYRSPVDRAFLARTLRLLDQRGVRAILMDILLDQPTEPDKDALLRDTIQSLRAPVVVSYGLADGGLTKRQIAFEDAFLRPQNRGLANIVKDTASGVVRSIYPGRQMPDGSFMASVVGTLVKTVGGVPPTVETPLVYRSPPNLYSQAFKVLPAHALAVLPKSWLEGKIVLIGSVLSLTDRHRTPYAVIRDDDLGTMPGVIIHAHAVAQLLAPQNTLLLPDGAGPGLTLVCAVLGLLLGRSSLAPGWRMAAGAGVMVVVWVGAVILARTTGGPLLPLLPPTGAFLVAGWVGDLLSSRQERERRRFLQAAFAKYVSPAVLEEIINDPDKMTLRAVRKEVSVIFTDVAGFTTLAETLDAEQLSHLLNRYRGVLSRTVFEHGGTINQFTGDGLYAMFNAPQDQPDHAVRALDCALALDRAATIFQEAENAQGVPFGLTRIGVHTGPAAVGNFGSEERFEYIALGDTINTASRVEGLNKYFGTRLCVTGPNAHKNAGQPFRTVGQVVMKGKTLPLEIFQPLTPDEARSPLCADYARAYALLETNDPGACTEFQRLAALYPDDGIIAFHRTRLDAGQSGTQVLMAEK